MVPADASRRSALHTGKESNMSAQRSKVSRRQFLAGSGALLGAAVAAPLLNA